MRDIATTTLSGNLTRDVELRQLPSGADVARLRVATTTRRRSGEEWVDKTNYFTVEVFGAQARACAEYLAKGSRVFVDGEPDWREWTDQQNNKREAVTFKARQVLFEGTRREPNPDGNGSRSRRPVPRPLRAPNRLRRKRRATRPAAPPPTTCRSDGQQGEPARRRSPRATPDGTRQHPAAKRRAAAEGRRGGRASPDGGLPLVVRTAHRRTGRRLPGRGRVARVEQRSARAMQSMRRRAHRDDAPTSAGGRRDLRTGGR